MPPRKFKSFYRVIRIGTALAVLFLLLAAQMVSAAPCDNRPGSPQLIRHDLTASFCELCSYGYITIIIANPYEGVDMTTMTVVEDLRNSGLTYDNTAPNPITARLNGSPVAAAAPSIGGTNGSQLTWTASQIPALGSLAYDTGVNFNILSITFAVTRASALADEGLVSADRRIRAELRYSTADQCFPGIQTVVTGLDTLDLREPDPSIDKRGRNVDASQGNWTSTVYGNVNDDIIWRIRVRNNGDADLQDLRFDDVMGNGNLQVNYICPTFSAASQIAVTNNGSGSAPGCVAANNTINNFDVDNPFGNPGSDSPDRVDVRQSQNAYIYLVGKMLPAPGGSCSNNTVNTVSDIQWGCQADSPAGGILATSGGSSPGSDTARLYSRYGEQNPLTVIRQLTGTNTSQPVGSKGTMTIILRNNSGGSIKNIELTDVLPPEYVVDPTFTPTVTMDPAYGNYPGMIDNITWDNPAADPLANTAPHFTLTSAGCSTGPCASTQHPIYSDQRDMMRRGDELTIVFRVVLINPSAYDKSADLDVRTEDVANGFDPDNQIQLTNQLTVEFDTFCAAQGHQVRNFTDNNIPAFLEDLDVEMAGSELVFILTADPNQRLPLVVNLTNNGGHDAADYVAYVTFGPTMDVVTVPGGCGLTSNPPPHEEWRQPAAIPLGAAVYLCTGPPIAPGQQVPLTFEVIKSQDAADLLADDLTFRADTVGEITLSDGTPLSFPTPINPRADGGNDSANNYSLDALRARVLGFNLLKTQIGNCSENNPPPATPDTLVQIGEECNYHIEAGGWFGFKTPGFTLIAVQDIRVDDQLPDGQGYISSTDPAVTSTGAIAAIALNPGGLQPLDEVAAPDWMNWTFNWGDALRIDEKDHWFRVDVTARLLNDPVNTRAAPNLHAAASTNVLNSYFQAIFENDVTGLYESFPLGPGTVGYPRLGERSFDLTVTEPNLVVVKQVCNESLYGVGPGCTNFVPLADDGDAYDPYIYRLTVTNEASDSGVGRAPAYDVTVTDVLDVSDLAYVLPFPGDGLDNDGDGASGEAGNADGTISNNTVKDGVPAQITFSHTHSIALLRIDPGQSVQLFYRVDYDDDAAPLQTFTNAADAAYDSLEGPSGNQSVVPQSDNNSIGSARAYTSAPGSATVRILPVVTQPKQITALSSTPLAAGPGPQPVVIGEEIEYRLHTELPVALLRNFVITDQLPAGLRCSEAQAVDLNAPPYDIAGFTPGGVITPTCSNNQVQWVFGDQRVTQGTVGNRYDFEIGFIARVDNTAGTNEGQLLSNGDPATAATASYIDESGSLVVLDFSQVDAVVSEPVIALTKSFAVAQADAGDILTVTVSAVNSGTATAYNLRVLDDLSGRNLIFLGSVGGANPPDIIDTATLGANRPIFGWSPPNGIAAGGSLSFTFDVRVDDVVEPHEFLDNTIQAAWTSLPGQSTALNSTGAIGADGSGNGMRIGALPGAGDAVNDYETVAVSQVEVPALTLTKTDLDPSLTPAIGTHKAFEIDIRLPEGVTRGIIATDSLDSAVVSYRLANNSTFDITYTFEGITSINGQTPSEAAFNAFPADGASGAVLWDIGTVVTQVENDPSQNAVAPRIRIQYYGRINNDLVTDSGDSLQNAVALDYTHGETGGTQTLNDTTAAVIAVEPAISAVKTVSNVTPGKQPTDPPGGGDLLEYEITVLNSGTATAQDVNLVDILPAQLSFYGGFTPTALINGVAVAGFAATPAGAPGGPLDWGRNNGDDSLDIPVGQSLVLTYRTVVQAVGVDLSNRVWIDWTSLDGGSAYERNGQGCPNWILLQRAGGGHHRYGGQQLHR